MQVEGVRWEVLQDAPGGWGVMGEVLPDAGSGSQASSAGGWVRVEVLRAVGIRREVLWDAPGEGQVGGASGCGLLGQANCALGGGGFARGASGCTGRGSGGRCFRMGTAGDRREVLRDAGSGSQASSASEGGGQAEEASCGGGSGGKSLGGMPLVEVRWEVHRVVGGGVRQGVHWAVGVWREVNRDLRAGVWWEVLPDARGFRMQEAPDPATRSPTHRLTPGAHSPVHLLPDPCHPTHRTPDPANHNPTHCMPDPHRQPPNAPPACPPQPTSHLTPAA
jgi:hypothetical protein